MRPNPSSMGRRSRQVGEHERSTVEQEAAMKGRRNLERLDLELLADIQQERQAEMRQAAHDSHLLKQ